jgi:ClpP class serine protease
MQPMDLLWVFLILSALQPVLRLKLLEYQRAVKMAKLQKERGSKVILLVHREETMRLLGFPLMRYIDIHDSEEVLRAIRMAEPEQPIDLVLHTPGGLVLASVQIARAIEAHRGRVTVFVPHHAMSGGTLVALAADLIVMCEHSVLGPIDPQIGQYPAASILRAVGQKKADEVEDETLIMADLSRKALDQVRKAATQLLVRHMPVREAEALAETLSSGTWTHDYPISAAEARAMGLPVSLDMPDDILELMTLYPQPVRQQKGVEYLPELPRPRPRPKRP